MSTVKRRGRPPHNDILTPGEWRVVNAVRHGMTSREIAERQNVSIDAVKYHVANALQKLALPDRKALRVWNGKPADCALTKKETIMTTDFQPNAIGQIARTVSDIAAAEEWYADKLGVTHLYTFGNLAFFDCDGTRLMLTENETGAENESILYFRTDNIEDAHTKLQNRGVDIINAPHMIHRHDNGTEEWMAFFNDNEGRPLALMSQVSA